MTIISIDIIHQPDSSVDLKNFCQISTIIQAPLDEVSGGDLKTQRDSASDVE